LGRTLNSYEQFSGMPLPEDAKSFAAYQSACKSALAHLDQLLKLGRWVENGALPSEEDNNNGSSELLKKAQQAIAELKDSS